MTENDLMLYVHIPFCVRKCHYCDFLSGAYDEETRRAYVKALLQEMKERSWEVSGRSVSSLFLGGGTPSLLDTEEMASIMNGIRHSFEVSADAEITVECNPGTVNLDKLRGYRELGINRLSLGVQSANDAELRLLGRIHTWEQFTEGYAWARKAGFENVNVDLISAIPGQTMERWKRTLRSVLMLVPIPEHISAYSLILEEGTDFFHWHEQGRFSGELALPLEDLDRDMDHMTKELLQKAGYHKYEISNYARKGYECRHNIGYWIRREYLGLGLGAASLVKGWRYQNTTELRDYIRNPLLGRQERQLSVQEEMEETMFLGLRMCRGVSRRGFSRCFQREMDELYGNVIQKNKKDGLLEDDGECIRLTPRGMDLSNYVMAQFLLE